MILAGPNGAGKSTLIGVLLGLVRADRGTLCVDGTDQPGVTAAFKERLGYLPEAVAFAEALTGRQVLLFFARARGVPRARVDEVLARVGLGDAARRAVRGYSRGMRQRLGLAVAILSIPELLILDEPTGGLDQEGLAVFGSILDEWREAGRLVLIATHDLGLMERRVDRIVVLKSGRVIADAPPAELRQAVALPIRVTFKFARDGADAAAFAASIEPVAAPGSIAYADGLLRAEVEPALLLALLDRRDADRTLIEGLRVEEPGLEQVYERLLEGGA
ncbi:MAG: ABC transporter ATP-binding protein [Polyangiaceae bacterium]|nr:ABC transporter ATP-binding protein [Polyangiaceae bacterium]